MVKLIKLLLLINSCICCISNSIILGQTMTKILQCYIISCNNMTNVRYAFVNNAIVISQSILSFKDIIIGYR